MHRRGYWLFRLACLLVVLTLPPSALGAEREPDQAPRDLEDALVELAAGQVGAALTAVADSTRALGDTYARLAAAPDPRTSYSRKRWAKRATTLGNTTGFRTWPSDLEEPPEFQDPYAGFYKYNDWKLSYAVVSQLNLFKRLEPTFRTAFESFPYSWVYMTTADDLMMIYPYLPIEEAVNNETPTETVFYEAADFENRAVGWTLPYLDLVGAGMMITASYPVFDGDTVLGVMSRDITLKQLADTVITRLAAIDGSTALLVDGSGLAIDASDPDLAEEIITVNTEAEAAVLYYRTESGLAALGVEGAVSSKSTTVNEIVEQVIAKAGRSDEIVRIDGKDGPALATRVEQTGWFVILILDEEAR